MEDRAKGTPRQLAALCRDAANRAQSYKVFSDWLWFFETIGEEIGRACDDIGIAPILRIENNQLLLSYIENNQLRNDYDPHRMEARIYYVTPEGRGGDVALVRYWPLEENRQPVDCDYTLRHVNPRLIPLLESWAIRLESDSVDSVRAELEKIKVRKSEHYIAIRQTIRESDYLVTYDDIIAKLGIGRGTVAKYTKALLSDGEIIQCKKKGFSSPEQPNRSRQP